MKGVFPDISAAEVLLSVEGSIDSVVSADELTAYGATAFQLRVRRLGCRVVASSW